MPPLRVMTLGLLTLGVATIGFGAAVVVAGLWLTAPARMTVGPVPAGLPGAEEVQINSASLLRGWWVPGRRAGGGVVVLLHGVRGNRLNMVPRAAFLQRHGFSVLLIDFQAHGESGGDRITFGKLESQDAAAAVDYAHRRSPGERVGVIGTSLGGAAALLGRKPLPVDALVLESVYPDIDAALSNRLRAVLGPWAARLLTPAFTVLLPPVLGLAPRDLRPIDGIGAVTAPVLVVSGTIDTRTPLAEAEALFARAPEPKWFWAVEGAGHVDLEQFDPVAYWADVLPFLSRTVQRLQDEPAEVAPGR